MRHASTHRHMSCFSCSFCSSNARQRAASTRQRRFMPPRSRAIICRKPGRNPLRAVAFRATRFRVTRRFRPSRATVRHGAAIPTRARQPPGLQGRRASNGPSSKDLSDEEGRATRRPARAGHETPTPRYRLVPSHYCRGHALTRPRNTGLRALACSAASSPETHPPKRWPPKRLPPKKQLPITQPPLTSQSWLPSFSAATRVGAGRIELPTPTVSR